jgi:hypothetical protein
VGNNLRSVLETASVTMHTLLIETGKTGTTVNVKRIPYSRSSAMEHMGKMLNTWIKDWNLLVKANEDPLKDEDNAKSFNAS